MPNLAITCVTRTLELVSMDEQHVTDVYGGGGSGRFFNGHGDIVIRDVQSRSRQIQTVWFKDTSGREIHRTLYNVDLGARPGHKFVEYEIQAPGKESRPLRYVNMNTEETYQVYDLFDLGIEWRMFQRPWEAGTGSIILGGILGLFVFGALGAFQNTASKGGSMFISLVVNPIAGSMLFTWLAQKLINSSRLKAYRQFEDAVNSAVRSPVRS